MTMKASLYLFATVAFLVVGLSAGAKISKRSESEMDSKDRCVPGTTWFDGCNSCFCTENGNSGCTLKACFTVPLIKTEEIKLVVVEKSDRECEPGSTFQRDCNACKCTDDGIAACTEKACLPQIEKTETGRKRRSAKDDEMQIRDEMNDGL